MSVGWGEYRRADLKDRIMSQQMRYSQEWVEELEGATPVRERSLSISSDPIGDEVMRLMEQDEQRRTWRERLQHEATAQRALSEEHLAAAESVRGKDEDLDYRLARVVETAFRCDRDFAKVGLGWAEDIAERIEERYPGYLESGFAKIEEEEQQLAESKMAKSKKATAALKAKRAA